MSTSWCLTCCPRGQASLSHFTEDVAGLNFLTNGCDEIYHPTFSPSNTVLTLFPCIRVNL